jgi:hypothetical protein
METIVTKPIITSNLGTTSEVCTFVLPSEGTYYLAGTVLLTVEFHQMGEDYTQSKMTITEINDKSGDVTTYDDIEDIRTILINAYSGGQLNSRTTQVKREFWLEFPKKSLFNYHKGNSVCEKFTLIEWVKEKIKEKAKRKELEFSL